MAVYGPPGMEGPPHLEVDPDSSALAAIFFEDGMTYLRLGDLESACQLLERAVRSDPTRGLFLAYYAYSVFRRDASDKEIKQKTLDLLNKAVRISPDDSDVYLIKARFHLKCWELAEARKAIDYSRYLSPSNPNIRSVERAFLKAQEES